MEILDKIGIVENKYSFVASIGSGAMVGKTTISVYIASKLVDEGKNVLFISEDTVSNILKKASKFSNNKKGGKFVVVGRFYDIERLNKIMDGRDFDYVFFDSFVFNDKNVIFDTINYVKSKNISMFVSVQLRRVIEPITDSEFSSISVMQKVDYAYILTKKETLTFTEKLGYWLRLKRIPNFNMNLVKNKFGRERRYDFHIDFKKIK
jgi:KaiC/GvpD/RAD55 family RecA-like ATPase